MDKDTKDNNKSILEKAFKDLLITLQHQTQDKYYEVLTSFLNKTYTQQEYNKETIQTLVNLNTLLRADAISVMNYIDHHNLQQKMIKEFQKDSITHIENTIKNKDNKIAIQTGTQRPTNQHVR